MTPMDLRGVPCPLNFVRTKLKLEQLGVGDRLEVWLDAGEPIQQVPTSLEVAGHQILELEPHSEGYYRMLVVRGGGQTINESSSSESDTGESSRGNSSTEADCS
ncbi:MAG: sulfurtransferase TusA family protein [Cyanobacteria bacterium P01_E01_bin.45]